MPIETYCYFAVLIDVAEQSSSQKQEKFFSSSFLVQTTQHGDEPGQVSPVLVEMFSLHIPTAHKRQKQWSLIVQSLFNPTGISIGAGKGDKSKHSNDYRRGYLERQINSFLKQSHCAVDMYTGLLLIVL